MPGTLYLIPVTLGDSRVADVIPGSTLETMLGLRYFVVEDLRTSRRYLRKAGYPASFDDTEFYLLNEHSKAEDLSDILNALKKGHSMGLMSEAGVPSVADPGSGLVALAHQRNIRVVPMVGPSSILLALMASGMNGQGFRFHGYLPVRNPERRNKLKEIERQAGDSGESQIFMETPYRNMSLLEDLFSACHDGTLLCIATDISLENEQIKSWTVAQWKKNPPGIHKRPSIFIIGSGMWDSTGK